jgi:hypothetical protein
VIIERAPLDAPSTAPTNKTAKVCPVIGTGHIGIAIWAATAVSAAPPIIRAISLAMLRGTTLSISVVLADIGRDIVNLFLLGASRALLTIVD